DTTPSGRSVPPDGVVVVLAEVSSPPPRLTSSPTTTAITATTAISGPHLRSGLEPDPWGSSMVFMCFLLLRGSVRVAGSGDGQVVVPQVGRDHPWVREHVG